MISSPMRIWACRVLCLSAAAAPWSAALAGSLSEAEAIARALARPEAQALDAAEQREAEAKALAVPRFDNPELTASRERVSGASGTETEWQLGVTQTIGLNGARASARRAAQAEAQAVGADIARRREQRIAEVRRAYAECRAAEERQTVLAEHAGRLRRVERSISLRQRAGDASGYDLRRIRVESRSIEARQALANGELQASCTSLARLTGEPDARASGPLLPEPSAAGAATPNRADIAARMHRAEAAEAAASAARRRQIPDVALGAGYKRIEEAGASASGPALSLGVRLPIFSSGAAERRAAEARAQAVQAELALARANVAAERTAAAMRAEAAREAAEIALRTAEDARRIAEIADAAYQGGEMGITELVDGYRASSEAQLAAIDHAERARIARIQFDLAQGGVNP